MMLQRTMYKKQNIDLSTAPWTMHEFFAGSGLVAYGLKGLFSPVWANDISEQKAAVYKANFGDDHFELGDSKDIDGHNLPFAHLSVVEAFWAEQVKEYFHNQLFVLTADTSKTIGANLDELFEQAKKRQTQNPGTQYHGTVLQHLVAAKLCLIMPEGSFEIHGTSVADAPTECSGDFVINSTIIHCTTMPGALLIEKCKANVRGGYHPVIITIFDRVHTALNLAEDAGLAGRVEVWDIQQFLSANVYEHSFFDEGKRNSTLSDIISRYNNIVLETETDPSLRIEFEAR